jgi:phosphodiesterase/alkaline phosphatase D-like protein
VNEVPIQQFHIQPYDRWEGYAAERERVLAPLGSEIKNVLFLTTDLHGNMIGGVRPAGSERSVAQEVITGPVALKTFAVDTNLKTGFAGAARAVGRYFTTPRPTGLGLSCAALDVYSYVQVRVTSRRVVVAPRDAARQPVREFSGRACKPLRVRFR